MADNMDSFKTLMEEMLREGNHYTNINLENFGAMCKKFDINLEAPDIEEIFTDGNVQIKTKDSVVK